MFLLKPKLLFIAFLLVGSSTVVCAQSNEPLEAAWVEKDIASVTIVLNLVPFENQSISLLKARLKDTWGVKEQEFGFGGKRLDLGKGNGYTMMFVEAFLFNGRVAYYELGSNLIQLSGLEFETILSMPGAKPLTLNPASLSTAS